MQLPLHCKGIQLIILFGSRVRAHAGRRSDTDIAVFADHPLLFEEKMMLGETAARELHVSEDDIDLVDLGCASPLLQQQIARNGTLLWGDAFAFVRFKVRAAKRYYDTAKFRRAREQALKQYVERSGVQKT